MCATCGCSDDAAAVKTPGQPEHHHPHPEHHHHTVLVLEQDVLAKNDRLAEHNRAWLAQRRILAVNLMSSPGSGKTTLLERTIRDVGHELTISVVEGDQETLLDAERIRTTGRPVVQINTGSGCHLDASMLERGLARLDPPPGSVVLIENVGNLVCPALFDLGEHSKIVIMSVTEGEDKPLKYPHMFRAAGLMLLNKVDLLPYVSFDVQRCGEHARRVNPELTILPVSATRGDGLDAWYAWLRDQSSDQASDQLGGQPGGQLGDQPGARRRYPPASSAASSPPSFSPMHGARNTQGRQFSGEGLG
jgi:hydrogenase nickel incorporation protein HypB